MRSLRVSDFIKDKVLVSRESARVLEGPLKALMPADGKPVEGAGVTVDFKGVEGIAPSFLDELLSIFEAVLVAPSGGLFRSLVVANPPTRLSLKFEAIARGHRMSVQALPEGLWLLQRGEAS